MYVGISQVVGKIKVNQTKNGQYIRVFPCNSAAGIVAPYNNAVRQLLVNQIALEHGSGIGTGQFYGVPGTGIDARTATIGNRRRYLGAGNGSARQPNSVIYVLRAPSDGRVYVTPRPVYSRKDGDDDGKLSNLLHYAAGNDLYQNGGSQYREGRKHRYMLYYYDMLHSYGLNHQQKL